MIEDTLRDASMAALPFFNREAVVRLLDRMPTMSHQLQVSLDPVILMMASMCIQHDRYAL